MKAPKLIAFAFLGMGAALEIAGAGAPALVAQTQHFARTSASDPGVRTGAVGAGNYLSTLTPAQIQFFADGAARFMQVDSVIGYGCRRARRRAWANLQFEQLRQLPFAAGAGREQPERRRISEYRT